MTKDICEVEACLKDLYETTINNYETAKAACAYYNQLVEDTMTDFSVPKLKDLYKAMNERMELVKVSLRNASEAQEGMGELTRYMECGIQAPQEAIEKTKEMLSVCSDKMMTACIQFQWENDKALVRDRQWQMVESKIDRYTEENEVILPGVHYAQNKLKLTGDSDLLLYHTYRYKRQLEDELNEAVAGLRERVNRAVEDTPPNNEKEQKDRNSFLESTLKEQRAQMDKDFKTRATAKLDRMVAEKVAAEKKIFAQQRSEMAAKLKILENKLAAHLKAEKETKRSQELWAAATSLLAATKKGCPCIAVDKELKAIQKASGGEDKLVATVMKSIPKTVWNYGVVPESVLKANYYKMEKTALKVALVEREGSPLPIYFVSWIQSLFLSFKVSGIPQVEVDNPPKEPPEDLDTFDSLQRARFWIERGDLATAIRYVASLEGASLVAAETWLEAARDHLEIRQAAEAIIAHAAALGLQYI
ncbi:MICOS complex subunit Mic60-like isoform X2 [Battus philenor]|uniref:MICOS complex subunit Mic60-like isoform X2 n=1 Tax=Battus philenor TaxID=42288 RepID=UPI0035CF4655